MQVQEPTSPTPDDRDERLSRRRLLRLGALLGLGALVTLTACGQDEDDEDEDEDEDD